MDTSVLYAVKEFLGIGIDNCAFDSKIIAYINMALGVLRQVGLGEYGSFNTVPNITGMEETWGDVIGEDEAYLEMVKAYVCMTAQLYFDPPANSFTVSSLKDELTELVWRIQIELERRGGII